jgi:hypothetical protein
MKRKEKFIDPIFRQAKIALVLIYDCSSKELIKRKMSWSKSQGAYGVFKVEGYISI